MKKFLLFAAAGLTLASCSQDDINNNGGSDEVRMSFSVNLPSTFNTRSLGEGDAATTLKVLVYDASDNAFLFDNGSGVNFTNGSANVDIDLITGISYRIVFFAASPTALTGSTPVYAINASSGELNVDYSNMTSQGNIADSYDCFYDTYLAENVVSGEAKSITLSRPVAQINWGTDDLASVAEIYGENGAYIESRLTATPYSTFNFLSGEVSGNTQVVEFPAFAIPNGESYPVKGAGMTYIAAQYMLAPVTNAATMDLTLWISNAGDTSNTEGPYSSVMITIDQAPVEANYQTNIYGSLFTDQTNITVSKDEWENGYNPDIHWDGKTVTYPTVTTDKNTPVVINRASDLAGLAQMVSGTGTTSDSNKPNDFEGYTITLAADFDMSGGTFPGIGSATRAGSAVDDNTKSFKGVFDGAGHTISNVTIAGTDNGDDAVGIFPNVSGSDAEIKNLVVDNLNINAPNNEQASVVGLLTDGATISNVTVTSGNISSAEGAAGIVGRVMGTGTVSGCENHATITVSNKSGGGIAGAAYYTQSEDLIIEKCTNYGKIVCAGTGANNESIGGIVGVSGAYISGCINNGEIVGVNTIGGIVGIQYSCGSITGCTNNGNITATGTYIGGILGWAGNNAYDLKEEIYVTGNTNYGTLTAPNGIVGGIMSINRATVYVEENTNDAPSITGSNAAGIVAGGYHQTNPNTGGNGYINYATNNVNKTPTDKITGTTTSPTYTGVVMINGTVYSDGAMPED